MDPVTIAAAAAVSLVTPDLLDFGKDAANAIGDSNKIGQASGGSSVKIS